GCAYALVSFRSPKIPVGAGLPAKAACQSPKMLKVTASSRASPPPQVLQRLGSTLRLEDQHRQRRQVQFQR
ncbi:hypothetical protein EJA70_29165, partial [Pseudomonas sp. PB103]